MLVRCRPLRPGHRAELTAWKEPFDLGVPSRINSVAHVHEGRVASVRASGSSETWGPACPISLLSYSRDDQATARVFAEGFEREGFSIWWMRR